ncbi:Hypothetical protein, predicted lipoprotein [Metamycoplasma auris 15026]|uniref:Lipoprotein n=1 Tax=Metamycoplasma auris 15026 TaxID=1188233 RepID=N9TTG8_9BACT|nr:hypothetical protein [Metamycoplasma auris]ENY69365.1 Hypothetical protein, predicted lipoprotein [Metamycoplasma auris 15026]
MNNKYKKLSLCLPFLGAVTATLSPLVLAATCGYDRPTISIKEDSKYSYINENNERIIKGSASEFYNTNRSGVFNPIDPSDPFYSIFKDNNPNVLNNKHNQEHKPKIKGNFEFLKFNNLTAPHSYRIYSFKYPELVTNIPGVATRKKYTDYKNNPKAVYIVLYWIEKSNEAAPNWVRDIVSPAAAHLNVPYSADRKEEAPWPFVKGIISQETWKNITEPVVLVFDKE